MFNGMRKIKGSTTGHMHRMTRRYNFIVREMTDAADIVHES
jgi:hypothetical protein